MQFEPLSDIVNYSVILYIIDVFEEKKTIYMK